MDELTKQEKAFIQQIDAEMRFYEEYKKFISEVKTIFIQKGEGAARNHIISNTNKILAIACDELFWSLFHKL